MISIVGNGDPVHVGRHLVSAAESLQVEHKLLDLRRASEGPRILTSLSWRLRGHRPLRMNSFSRYVRQHCEEARPSVLICTGLAAVTASDLRRIGAAGVKRVNFLTDDPWNPAHRAPWFMESLREYDCIFSPRTANRDDLLRHGCQHVERLPFAYAPEIHFPELARSLDEPPNGPDVAFVGGGDADRVPFADALLKAGMNVALYGGYWDRYPATRVHALGLASPEVARQLARNAKVSVCMVRRANRDGHCMRTFELPAMGACIVADDTPEHRTIFGEEGENVLYFREPEELVAKVRRLVASPQLRADLRRRCHERIVAGGNQYKDRLSSMIAWRSER